MTHVLRARRLLTEEGWLDDHQLRIADGVIAAIEPIPVGVTERDAELLCPRLHRHPCTRWCGR